MIIIMKDMPENILGIEAHGRITQEDYKKILIPAAEEKLKKFGKLKALYYLGDLEAFEMAAMWEDASFAFGHWNQFERLALVTDHAWAQGLAAMFRPFLPAEMKIFDAEKLAEAKTWVALGGEKKKTAAR